MRVCLVIPTFMFIFVFSGNMLIAKEYEDSFSWVASAFINNTSIKIDGESYKVLEDLPKVRLPISEEVNSTQNEDIFVFGNPCYRSTQGPRIITRSELNILPYEQASFTLIKEIKSQDSQYLFLRFTSSNNYIQKILRKIYFQAEYPEIMDNIINTVNFLLIKEQISKVENP